MSWLIEVVLVEDAHRHLGPDGFPLRPCHLKTHPSLVATVILQTVCLCVDAQPLLRVHIHQPFSHRHLALADHQRDLYDTL